MLKVMSIFGTRPEAIKMCPLVQRLEEHSKIHSVVCVTGQHEQMADQVLELFGIHPQYRLRLMRPGQSLASLTAGLLEEVTAVLQKERPDLVLVHGDTTTALGAALAAFYERIPVGHVEAGLRTGNPYSPFPEEMNRTLIGQLAALHFAPTRGNQANLEREHVRGSIAVTGNTIMDGLRMTFQEDYCFKNSQLGELLQQKQQVLLLTAHRRENLGEPLKQICYGVKRLAEELPELTVIYPMHPNPQVRSTVLPILGNTPGIYLMEPLDVEDMHHLLRRTTLVLTDSGGLQEEAPACGVPVLTLRKETERPEAVEAGAVKVIGLSQECIYQEAKELLTNRRAYEAMSQAVNPYGDGYASERIVEAILLWSAKKDENVKGTLSI